MVFFTYMELKQGFKSIYFPDLRETTESSKSLTLAFSEHEQDLFESIRHLSSHDIRKLIEAPTFNDLETSAGEEGLPINRYCIWKLKKSLSNKDKKKEFGLDPIHTTFQSSKEIPLQGWYPYLEGYAPDFVKYIIQNYLPKKTKVIYDPFSGTGTTPLVASELGHTAYYSEVNPLLQVLTKTKSKARGSENRTKIILSLEKLLSSIKKDILAQEEDQELKKSYFNTFKESKFFDDKVFGYILKTRTYLNKIYFDDVLVSELVTIATIGSLVENSYLKRQGDLRFRREKELEELKNTDYFETLIGKLKRIIADLKVIKTTPAPLLITEDARTVGKLPFIGIDAVVTSPPYLNGTNYFRNTKIELWFLGYLKGPENLSNFRKLAVTAGINDVALGREKKIDDVVLKKLLSVLEKKAYDKRIPKMVNDYFADMKVIFTGIKKQLNDKAVLAIDLGDSIYSGIHVKTDEIFIRILSDIGYTFDRSITLRKRQSNNGQELKQVLLLFKNKKTVQTERQKLSWEENWNAFKEKMPHHQGVMAKRNWGDQLHSLCSYQGKLKPSIAHQLVATFVPKEGIVLDLFGGVGTIPLEAALQDKKSFSFDISPTAIAISRAKLDIPSVRKVGQILDDLESFIKNEKLSKTDLEISSQFGLNKTIKDYFHPKTLREIILARNYFKNTGYSTTEHALVMSAMMHILHGNRPYALSRRSHGITPFAPTGEFEYKDTLEKLKEKIERTLSDFKRLNFQPGVVYYQDATKTWPEEVKELDAIITSPPFFDSTRFYAANWMRLWFAGWDKTHFKTEPVNFIDELQKKDLSIYDGIFMQARERLKEGGVFVMHLGKSHKCDMAKALSERAGRWFNVHDIFEENVEDGESHGIKDRGSVKTHQYLILT
jgi:tRNA G10  N-methylase Trm11